jgi:predicted nuclease of predicted toxin-antitoxin system
LRFLACETVPGETVKSLQAEGFDVLWLHADAPGKSDGAVVQLAVAQKRILLTFDPEFAEFAYRSPLPATSGVILFRIRLFSSQRATELVTTALMQRSDWAGQFSVVEDDRIRMKPLPGKGKTGTRTKTRRKMEMG